MKHLIIIFFLLPATTIAGSAISMFELANLKYKEGKYDSSITLYNQLLNQNYVADELFFNVGNAYYKTGQYANAIINYERALKIKPGNGDYQHNLKLANSYIIDKIEAPSLVFYERAWQNFLSKTSANQRGITGIILLYLSLAVFTVYLFMSQPNVKKITFFSSLSILMIAFLFLFISFVQNQNEQSIKYAIIFSESEYVKSSPGIDSKNLFMLHSGTKVKVIGDLNEWKQIKLPNGSSGWISHSALETI